MLKKIAIIAAVILFVAMGVIVVVQYSKIQKLSIDSHTLSNLVASVGAKLGTDTTDWGRRLDAIQQGRADSQATVVELQGVIEGYRASEQRYLATIREGQSRIADLSERLKRILQGASAEDSDVDAAIQRLESFGRRLEATYSKQSKGVQ